jgi:hypothetical protein
MNSKTMNLFAKAGLVGLAGLLLSGCSSEPNKVKMGFRVINEKGEPMEEIQITFLSKDRKYAEMCQSVGGGLGSVMLYPNVYGIGVNKYEGGKSIQSMTFGSEEYKFAMEKYGGSIPPSNILPPELEDPFESGLEVAVKPGMETVDIVVKGVTDIKKTTAKPAIDITKGKGPDRSKTKEADQPSETKGENKVLEGPKGKE